MKNRNAVKTLKTGVKTAVPHKARGPADAAPGAGSAARTRQPNTSGDATRTHIITIAEHLFAARGVEGVSLADINRSAGQRNKYATQYYFGDKQGLLQAILDKHEPGIAARQTQLISELETSNALTPRNVVQTMIQPLAEKLFDVKRGGRNYLRFSAQLVVGHTLGEMELKESSLRIAVPPRLRSLLAKITEHVPRTVANQRGILAAVLITQSLAEWARMLDAGEPLAQLGTSESFVSNLVDTVAVLYSTPPSESTLGSLRPVRSARRQASESAP